MVNESRYSAKHVLRAYLFQFQRALLHLVTSPPNSRIGLEIFDDVVVDDGDTFTFEQDKYSKDESKKHYGNTSLELWKTLRIWLHLISDEDIDFNKATFFLVSNRSISDGLAQIICDAISQEDAISCVSQIKEQAKSVSESTSKYSESVIQYPDEILIQLIRNINCVDGNDKNYSPQDFTDDIANKLLLPSWVPESDVVNGLLGWVVTTCIQYWDNDSPAWISKDDFVAALHSTIESIRRKKRRELSEIDLIVHPHEIESKKEYLFVRQLHAVEANEETIFKSIEDFIRCSRERLRLSQEGEVMAEDWKEFDSRLHRRWSDIYNREISLSDEMPEIKVGLTIFFESIRDKEILAGEETIELYLTSGSFHRMANIPSLGWHPNYKGIFLRE